MTALIRHPNLDRVDDIYEQLLAMHDGLDEAQSLKVSARLILVLANHIGDSQVVMSAIALARSTAPRGDIKGDIEDTPRGGTQGGQVNTGVDTA